MNRVVNPATEETIVELPEATAEDADRADGRGFWDPPTVLAPVSNDERAAREEIFGPVAAVIPFEDEADAVRIATNTSVRVQTPFGGCKQSGFGRELGLHALDGYSEVENVYYATDV